MVLFDVQRSGRRQQSGATLALTLRAAQCIKRRFGPATNCRALALVVRTRYIAEGRKRSNFRTSLSSPSPSLAQAATAASKCTPSFHMRPIRTASFLATAIRARLGPTVLINFNPQLRRAKRFLTVVSSTLAASYR